MSSITFPDSSVVLFNLLLDESFIASIPKAAGLFSIGQVSPADFTAGWGEIQVIFRTYTQEANHFLLSRFDPLIRKTAAFCPRNESETAISVEKDAFHHTNESETAISVEKDAFHYTNESETFVSLYQSYKKESAAIMSVKPAAYDSADATAEAMILCDFNKSERLLALRRQYYTKFREILSPVQIQKMYDAEREAAIPTTVFRMLPRSSQ